VILQVYNHSKQNKIHAVRSIVHKNYKVKEETTAVEKKSSKIITQKNRE
jgi:hypothetical protein